jgi:hypothetical protein
MTTTSTDDLRTWADKALAGHLRACADLDESVQDVLEQLDSAPEWGHWSGRTGCDLDEEEIEALEGAVSRALRAE